MISATSDVTKRDERMLALRGEGRSSSEIAEALGMTSRNSVLSRINWLRARGVAIPAPRWPSGPGAGGGKAKPINRPRKSAPARMVAAPKLPAIVALAPAAPSRAAAFEVPKAGGVALMDLGAACCRWPFGNPVSLYCGAATGDIERPFCAHHAAIAYRPREERRR